MRCTLYTIICLAILACFSVNSANAEAKKKTPKAKKSQNKIVDKYDETAFDLTRDALPLNYRGHDVMKIYTVLNKQMNITKTEFETTEQFNMHLANERSKPILGKLTVNDTYSFMIKPNAEYDADKKSLELNISTSNILIGFGKFNSDVGINIKQLSNENKSIAKNAYGSTVEVTDRNYSSYCLSITNPFDHFEWTYRYKIAIPAGEDRANLPSSMNEKERSQIKVLLEDLAPDLAKQYKDKIRIIFVVKLVDPFISSGSSYRPATYDWPSSYYSTDYNINCRTIEMWVYNIKTGAVLKKIKIPSTATSSN